jgi:hypothetical protein
MVKFIIQLSSSENPLSHFLKPFASTFALAFFLGARGWQLYQIAKATASTFPVFFLGTIFPKKAYKLNFNREST